MPLESNSAMSPEDSMLQALASQLATKLRARGWRVASAESCTGGWIAKICTDLAGSSDWFEGGVVSYSNALKQTLLGVSAGTLERHGAVSAECAAEMVAGARSRMGVDLAVAVTGVAGPSGGSADKPVGLVWFGWQRADAAPVVCCHRFDGGREAVRRKTVAAALSGLIELA